MPNISRTVGSITKVTINSNSKTVHKKNVSELAKKVNTVRNKAKEFKTKSNINPEALGSFFRESDLKSQGPVIKLEIRKCLEGVKNLKEMMENTSYVHAKSKHKSLDKMEKILEKAMDQMNVNSKKNHEKDMYNQMMINHEKNAITSKNSRPVREKGEYNGGMVK